MSILLEALRKSEKSQRPVEVPTIHQAEQGAPESVNISRGPLMLLLAAALIVIAWLVWRQYQPSEVGYQPPVSLPAKNLAQTAPPVAEGDAPDPETVDSSGGDDSSGGPRTPVESYKQPVRVATAPVAARRDGRLVNRAGKNQAYVKKSIGKQTTQPEQGPDSPSKAVTDLTPPKSVAER